MRVCIHRGAKLVRQQDHRLTRLARLRRVAKSTRTVSWSARPAIAVLLAAADFESIVRRAIIALGHSPNTIPGMSFSKAKGPPPRWSGISWRDVHVRPEQSVEVCMALMTDKRVRHLPVLEGKKVIGIVSIGDLLKAIISEQKFVIDELEHYIRG